MGDEILKVTQAGQRLGGEIQKVFNYMHSLTGFTGNNLKSGFKSKFVINFHTKILAVSQNDITDPLSLRLGLGGHILLS